MKIEGSLQGSIWIDMMDCFPEVRTVLTNYEKFGVAMVTLTYVDGSQSYFRKAKDNG